MAIDDYATLNVLNVAKAWRRAHRRDDKVKARIHLMRLAAAVDTLDHVAADAARDDRIRKTKRRVLAKLHLLKGGRHGTG